MYNSVINMKSLMQKHKEIVRSVAVLALLLIGSAGVYLFSGKESSSPDMSAQESTTMAEQIRAGVAPIPPMTPDLQQKIANSKGFQALASYTELGFEPVTLRIKLGETVRFTNNSSKDLWVAAGGNLYPKIKGSCGSSDLDSCTPFAPQDFWEFTFEKQGTWTVVNNLSKDKQIVVTVE